MEQSIAIVTGVGLGIGPATAIRLTKDHSILKLSAQSEANPNITVQQVRVVGLWITI
jgi:NADP-dependent 3-hydroxy acid dehydrogenase YdfG